MVIGIDHEAVVFKIKNINLADHIRFHWIIS